jgi:hypothetical protein
MADRYKNQDHIIWEIFNEPHNVSWSAWVPMAQQLVDTIRARNPVSKAIVVATANWDQQADVKTLKINREKIIYSWHPYDQVYGSIGASTWESRFGYIMTSGVAPVMNTEWGGGDAATYGTQLIQYMKNMGMSWTGWCYSADWGPTMLSSVIPEVRNASGNLMYKACHDTIPVTTVAVDVSHRVAGSVSAPKAISIDGSFIRFNCVEPSPVTVSLYDLNGRMAEKVLDGTLTKGNHSVRWRGTGAASGIYTVLLKIKNSEYHTVVNVTR